MYLLKECSDDEGRLGFGERVVYACVGISLYNAISFPFRQGVVGGEKLMSWEPCCDALAPLRSISLFDCFEAHLGLVPQRVSINRVIPLPPLMSFYVCVCVFASEV